MAKRDSSVLEDPLDRALSYREHGLDRKNLDDIGFLPSNRGSLGLSGHHVHEVSWSCVRGVKLVRYKQVDIVRMSEAKLSDWREKNKHKCESDRLMPSFSPKMRYACLTKTHFTHANKLARDGNRTIFNEGKVDIKYEEDNFEGRKILDDGVLCCVYREALLDDPEALQAIMDADNDDADIEMGEDEIQAQGRVESAITFCMAKERQSTQVAVDEVLGVMRRAGLRAFTEDDTRAFIQFRMSLSTGVAQCFRSCVFHFVCGRVRVTPHDYMLVSGLEPRAMWLKASIIIRQYLTTLADKFPPGVLYTQATYAGRGAAVSAKKLSSTVMKELRHDVQFLLMLEGSITQLIRHYRVKNAFSDKVMDARTKLFSNFGKLALRVAHALSQAVLKAASMKAKLEEEQRKRIIDENMKGQLAEIEHKYAEALVDATALEDGHQLHKQIWQREKKAVAASVSDPATPVLIDDAMISSGGNQCVFEQRVLITESMVMHRLRAPQLPHPVRLRNLTCLRGLLEPAEPAAAGNASSSESSTHDAAPAAENASSSSSSTHDAASAASAAGGSNKILCRAMLLSLTQNANAQSGWIGRITYGCHDHDVDSDMLLPPEKDAKEPEKVEITKLAPFDWERSQCFVMRNVASYAMDQVFVMTYDVQAGVVIEQVGDVKSLPCKLRVKAARDFKAGELMLSPYSLLAFPAHMVDKDDAKANKYATPDLTQMDSDCIPRAFVKVLAKDKSSDIVATYYVTSPRFLTKERLHKETATANMSPLWALSSTTMNSLVNMAMQTVIFDVAPLLPIGAKVPNQMKKALWTVAVQCARNTRKITKGEYLHVSAMYDDDEEI